MMGLSRELLAVRVARELRDGMYVNLGIGIPTLVSSYVPPEIDVVLHSENGILGYGRIAADNERDIDLVNAGGQPITLKPGASFCHHADSFAMIRGGHLDLVILGAFQVSERGDLANWSTPEKPLSGIGGAMDLTFGAKRVFVAMEHVTASGEPRIVRQCSYPLTARGVVNRIFTNLAVIEVKAEGLVLLEVAPGVTPGDVQRATEPRLILDPGLREMEL